MNLVALAWLMLLGLGAAYVWRALQARELAYAAAHRECENMQVQLLDQSVYLRKLWFRRNKHGRLGFWRVYYFEFTVTGGTRYVGRVFMLGRRIERVELEPHPIP